MRTLAFAAVILAAQVALPTATYAASSTQSVFIPLYKYPQRWRGGDLVYWNSVVAAGGQKVPFVVVNPQSGPGAAVNADYTGQLADLDAAGVKYIGYVKHNRQSRDIHEVAAEIDAWYQFYPGIQGIMFDETESNSSPDQACYIANIYNYMKVKHPGSLVAHNPGTRMRNERLVPYGDLFMVAEARADDYINDPYFNLDHPTASSFEKDPANANKIWHVVHTSGGSAQQDQVMALAKQRNAGWVFVTNDVEPNPYDGFPGQFDDFINKTSAMPQTTVANGQPVPLMNGCNDVFNLNVTAPANPVQPPATPLTPSTPVATPAVAAGAGGALQAPNTGYQRQTGQYTIMFIVVGVVLAAIGGYAGRKFYLAKRRR